MLWQPAEKTALNSSLSEKSMERKASDYRNSRPGVDGLTPTEDPVAHEPMEKEPDETAEAAIEGQAPARMTSPRSEETEKEAIDALVAQGVTRERAEQLVAACGVEDAKPASQASETTPDSARKASLKRHHVEGIPPYDTPGLADEEEK
jgi:hypothetical protein